MACRSNAGMPPVFRSDELIVFNRQAGAPYDLKFESRHTARSKFVHRGARKTCNLPRCRLTTLSFRSVSLTEKENIMTHWKARCDDPSHPPWVGPLRDDWDKVQADRIRHDGSRHGNEETAVVEEVEEE